MPSDSESLRAVLENLRHPEKLDSHPWASRPFVQEARARHSEWGKLSAGAQLVSALTEFFAKTVPPNPPRRGKRLDTRWGEFGLLAAQYFAPVQFGTPAPASLREAWGRIDHSILLFVFGRTDSLTDEQTTSYKLVGDEPEVAPASTLSDWHTKGIQRLADALQTHEQFLAKPKPCRRILRPALLVFLILILAFLAWAGFKAKRVYDLSLLVWQDASQLREQVAITPSIESIKTVGPSLTALRDKFEALQTEVQPYLWIAPRLGWVPAYGGDIAASPNLFTLADSLLASADQTYTALSPVLEVYDSENLDIPKLIGLLNDATPQLTQARLSLDLARDTRTRIDSSRLSPRLRGLLDDLDPLLPLLDDGLTLALALPRATGASSDGPKTYLLLAQNEDELRPGGGFITAAGTLLVQDGKISNLTFQNSGELDNWERPYPNAPWQMQQYMNIPVLVFRDSNWFTDFPETARYAEYLYSYHSNHSVDGVIAFDQQFLVEILRATGPISVDGESESVNVDNAIAFMRAEKTPNREDLDSLDWNNKKFMNKIASALMDKILSGAIPPQQLASLFMKAMQERHLLIQIDDPALTDLLARRGWDGALRPSNGDFLMVVDSNIGFNKTSALVQTNISYDIDLTDLSAPRAELLVSHQNNAATEVTCLSYPYITTVDLGAYDEKDYPMNRCYADYLRVYTVAGTNLLDADMQTVPAEWTILKRAVPPQVDVLDEKIEGIRSFGALKVIPGGQSLASRFVFALPISVVQADARQMTYRLKVQKQPGTLGVAITVRLHLPDGARPAQVPNEAKVDGANILFQSTLVTDLVLEFVFAVP